MNEILTYLNTIEKTQTTNKGLYQYGRAIGAIRGLLQDLELTEEQLLILRKHTKELEDDTIYS